MSIQFSIFAIINNPAKHPCVCIYVDIASSMLEPTNTGWKELTVKFSGILGAGCETHKWKLNYKKL